MCRLLAETATGSQIDRLMTQAGLRDVSGVSTKWKRLYYSAHAHQRRAGDGRALVALLHAFMEPGRWASRPEEFDRHRAALNVNLARIGLQLGKDGRVVLAQRAHSLDEAQERADALAASCAAAACARTCCAIAARNCSKEATSPPFSKPQRVWPTRCGRSPGFGPMAKTSSIRRSHSSGTCPRWLSRLQDPWELSSTPGSRHSRAASSVRTATPLRTHPRCVGPLAAARRWTC